MKTVALSILAYGLLAFLMFGSFHGPLLLMLASAGLGAPYWQALVGLSAAIVGVAIFRTFRHKISKIFRPPVFIMLWMVLSIVSVGVYADWLRRDTMAAFDADEEFQHSFFRSIRETPRQFQFFLHSAALKDCVPYAWSYREMDLYRLPESIVDVLPPAWVRQCGIEKR